MMMKAMNKQVTALALAVLPFLGAGVNGATSPDQTTNANASYFNSGNVFIVTSSHQDTAWIDTPAACRKYRIESNLKPALEMMRKDTNYTFCMEGALHVMELLDAHPEMRDEVIQRMKEGRLEFGGTYNEPYESWLSGEELIRETYFGRRWIQKNLPGCDTRVAFNPDPPARSLQTQQILAKAGIPYMFISRYHEGLYRWASPDGSSILAYTPGHYMLHQGYLNGKTEACIKAIRSKLAEESSYYEKRDIPPTYCFINTHDISKPVDFRPLITAWNTQLNPHPVMRYASIRGFFEAIDQPKANFDRLMGERPDVWVYITGPTHHWTSDVKREAARLLPAAETFTTFACLLDGNFHAWPTKELNTAWKDEIYMDHGIGGNNGHITDAVFYNKAVNARDTGRKLLNQSLGKITTQVKTDSTKGIPVTVFNDLSWPRSGPVEMDLPPSTGGNVRVLDAAGHEIPHQLTTVGAPDEINVAAGARAAASSIYSAEYGPEKAVDGRWDVADPNLETGTSTKWNSASGPGPHWLTLDFGGTHDIHKVVIRHEGVVGRFGCETQYNTVNFQIQSGATADGPWTDLVRPVVSNTASLTVHEFTTTPVRFLRVFVTKGAAADSTARIYEVQAFEKTSPKPRLLFVADDVPPLGYKTFYLAAGDSAVPTTVTKTSAATCENDFYRLMLAPGGIKSIFDKQQKREVLDTGKFLGGEVFTMSSCAPNMPDAGEAGAVVQPAMDATFDRVATHKPEWKQIEGGPVRSVFQLEQPLADTTVRQRVVLWNQMKRLDCEVDLNEFNGHLWREFRMALPLAMENPQLAYEVPMGVVRIGKDEIPTTGGRAYGDLDYFQQCRDIRPRMVQDFVDASDARGGLTMSSSVSVFDWIDPTTNAPGKPLLQPLLLASRKSCHWTGVWYPQAGDHTFRFALTTHEGDWRNGRQYGIAANHPFHVVMGATPAAKASLPTEMSLASVSANNVIVSTIKKCEDDDSVIARVYDIEGKDGEVALKLFQPVSSAEKTSLIEEDGAPLAATGGNAEIPVGHNAIETVKLKTVTQ
jgi:alpha-mannosidase